VAAAATVSQGGPIPFIMQPQWGIPAQPEELRRRILATHIKISQRVWNFQVIQKATSSKKFRNHIISDVVGSIQP
jgi:hypothetical protein